jgi:hydroxypyruvate isomerase
MEPMNRRRVVGLLAAGTGALLGGASAAGAVPTIPPPSSRSAGRGGHLKQSVSYWPYAKMPLAEFARAVKPLGLVAIDLLQPEEWPAVQDAGLTCSMGYPSKRRDFLSRGFNDQANHDLLTGELETTIPLAAAAGVPNVIAMFGNRKGRGDEEGAANCITGLKRVAVSAERHGVTVCVELLNSKVDHKDYMGDHTAFGVKVVEGVGSPRIKLLYDIYHMQIMEGDVIRTLRDNIAHIGHFHTGGVPGRQELDDTQEINWRAVCQAIVATGYTGYLAHEFMPSRDPLTSLREAVALCDV